MPYGTISPPITAQQALDAKIKNIIELGLDFSAMTRVFAGGSYDSIVERLEGFVSKLRCVGHKEEYEHLHAEFCQWFTERVCTARKQFKNGTSRPSCACSYGQAAKVLDVAAKVYVYYCGLPSAEIANRLIPLLHAALDTKMMEHLGVSASLLEIDRRAYADLQARAVRAIGDSGIHPVQYDDVIWRRLNRSGTQP
ncbi:MAG: hypothetical protein M1541_16875 [Acidobacteria bacterium]|nr:hypothetical protein [Acidobacteriota bacterium]